MKPKPFTLLFSLCFAASSLLAIDPAVRAAVEADLPFGTLSGDDFWTLGGDLSLPDNGTVVSAIARSAPGGAFDPRVLERVNPEILGYEAKWFATRYSYYNLDWDIPALRLTSLDPEAKNYPWIVIVNGGSANFYEFFIDLKNEAGWGQYLAQKVNVLIVTIPGNFKYGGWTEPPEARIAPYVLDREISFDEFQTRTAIYTNEVIMEGLRHLFREALGEKDEVLIVGHSTSGELAFLAMHCEEIKPRMAGRYLGWGSGGPARYHAIRRFAQPDFYSRARTYTPVYKMNPRSAEGYVRSRYVGPMNPLYIDGMSDLELAQAWFAAEGRRRPMFKQPLQSQEHGPMLEWRGQIEIDIEKELNRTGNRFNVPLEDVVMDLMTSHFAPFSGWDKMLWIVAREDRNHWLPEDEMNSRELFIANLFRRKDSTIPISVLKIDLPMTHYGHVEAPKELAALFIDSIKLLSE
jgi:pimeloyl-ACP methyl ester carboxylesterase